jgi:DNA-binding NarL/FixJ family response regulator
MHEDPYLVGEAFRAGASAFLLKEAAASELTEAIAKALKGGSYVTPSASEGLTNISLREPKHREHAPEPTPRQREVIQVLGEGHSMKQVADELKITVRTVAGHKYAVMGLLQLKTNTELVQYAIEHRIIGQKCFSRAVDFADETIFSWVNRRSSLPSFATSQRTRTLGGIRNS